MKNTTIKIKIIPENADKINSIISDAEGRATARTCDYNDVEDLAGYMEKQFQKYECPKKDRKGARASYCQKIGVKAYSKIAFHAHSTEIQIFRGSSDWFFTGAVRSEINPSDKSSSYWFCPSASALESVKRKAVMSFGAV